MGLTKQEIDTLFASCTIGAKTAPNRLVSQPMEANDAEPGGGVSKRALARSKNLACGKWGIVIVESLSVTGAYGLRYKEDAHITLYTLVGFVEAGAGYTLDKLIFGS